MGDFNAHHINWNCNRNKTDTNDENFHKSLLKTNQYQSYSF